MNINTYLYTCICMYVHIYVFICVYMCVCICTKWCDLRGTKITPPISFPPPREQCIMVKRG